ncbi:unnamed protein product [Plutella xylostella]|uniref:GATA zinc finger domain-containing protein 1 n=1 Tax=Plutella xylostella TaxID=51655 RepID=A0A8S4G7T6_PLUXY|nr:GATA zinc finger domain-containing protein 1 [Plutella xylostella]CAG9135677.1 unnamed protein product [Plutella xylostella]
MPKPTCVKCDSTDSFLWRNTEGGQICNECHLANSASKDSKETKTTPSVKTECQEKMDEDIEPKNEGETTPAKATGKGTRKSTRATRYKPKTPSANNAPKTPAPRGRGRRSLFKRPPLKAPTATATVVTSDSVFYQGTYMQVGDIVSMIDVEGGTYYAQIRGFMTDQYCEKSAVITWLLPTKASPPPDQRFDPATYIIGPEEELPRKLEVMEFVMHAPCDYYKTTSRPYPLDHNEANEYKGFVWTSLEPKDRN